MLGRLLPLLGLSLLASPALALTIYKYTDANGVVTYSDQAAPGSQVFVFRDRMVEKLDNQVKLETRKHAAGETLVVRNDLFAPVDIELKLEGVSNAVGAPAEPIRWVLPPRSQIRLATLAPRDASKPLRYTPKLRHALGDPRLLPKPYKYPLPWRGGPVPPDPGRQRPVQPLHSQGAACGGYRHARGHADHRGAWRHGGEGGKSAERAWYQPGRQLRAHPARRRHEGVYLHLMKGSVTVQEGQRVATGTRLARSGNTGNSTGPHLHFVVQRNVGLAVESIPFAFSQPVDSLPNFAVGGE
ncbi:hypothetical protein SSTU70S_04694 [Stutzerimonas stutzeri]